MTAETGPIGPIWLYLHGFASSPQSKKARAFVRWGEAHGIAIRALDLRAPSLEHLRFSAILSRVKDAIGEDPRTRVVLVGSSLGGLTACRVAADDPRVCAVYAMAPAFGLAARWRARLGEAAWAAWKRDDALAIDAPAPAEGAASSRSDQDCARGAKTTVDFGFVEELERLEADGPPDLRVPTCIVHGIRDEIVDIASSRAFAAAKRHVRLVELDDGHELTASTERLLSEANAFFKNLLG